MPLTTRLYPPSSTLFQLYFCCDEIPWEKRHSFEMKKDAYCCIEHLLCSYLAVREPTEDTRKDRHQKVLPLSLLQKQSATWCSCWGNYPCLSGIHPIAQCLLWSQEPCFDLQRQFPSLISNISCFYQEAWLRNEYLFYSAGTLAPSISSMGLD